jgi:hypothetical protein
VARTLRRAILDLFWDKEKLAFYDFNLTANARNGFFSAAAFSPPRHFIPSGAASFPMMCSAVGRRGHSGCSLA